jgi:hypothetical protein
MDLGLKRHGASFVGNPRGVPFEGVPAAPPTTLGRLVCQGIRPTSTLRHRREVRLVFLPGPGV